MHDIQDEGQKDRDSKTRKPLVLVPLSFVLKVPFVLCPFVLAHQMGITYPPVFRQAT